MNLSAQVASLAATDLFRRDANGELETGIFVGRPFYLDYDRLHLLVADAWKAKVMGLPQGSFLLAYYDNEEAVQEALLLRVLEPTKLPTDDDVTSSMVEYYKDNLQTSGSGNQLDQFTRYEFSFSGLACRVLGTFYNDLDGQVHFGADVENFYSAHNYRVYKPNRAVLELIVNFREDGVTGKENDIQIGKVRYSSSRRFQQMEDDVPVYVSPADFLGKRTALFGMTRTGKSNTVKKIIQATVNMSRKAKSDLGEATTWAADENLEPLAKSGLPKFPAGQIIFDINGEYANANLQDAGTAIFEIYQEIVTRYSVLKKEGFKVMKVNFYEDVLAGFELVRSALVEENSDYFRSFLAVDLTPPETGADRSTQVRYERQRAAYLCCLYAAGLTVPAGYRVRFAGRKELNELAGGIDPSRGITLEEAKNWFAAVWEQGSDFFEEYKQEKGHDWADEDLKAILVVLTRRSKAGSSSGTVSGFKKLTRLREQHTEVKDPPFAEEILARLREGKIVIVDLSQGDPEIQRMYSERICRQIFGDAMNRFIRNQPNNFIQFYFEEAHNLFPKKDEKDLSQIYNRIAKEGAKLNLGLVYATQEVSSISANILKNTQNWFIAHLNNDDETKEIKKYYDFGDFVESLVRFSANTDKGFVRMKTYSNPFVVPVQIDRFAAKA